MYSGFLPDQLTTRRVPDDNTTSSLMWLPSKGHTQHECGTMTRPRRMTLSLFPPRMTGGPTNISLASTRIHLFPARCSVWLSPPPSRRMDAILSQSYRTREAPAKGQPKCRALQGPSRSEYLLTSTRDPNGGISSVTIGRIDCSPLGSMFALLT